MIGWKAKKKQRARERGWAKLGTFTGPDIRGVEACHRVPFRLDPSHCWRWWPGLDVGRNVVTKTITAKKKEFYHVREPRGREENKTKMNISMY